MGRPRIYDSPEELEAEVEKYFKWVEGEYDTENNKWARYGEPATVTGLALFLGFADRQSLYDYSEKPEFSCIIKRARTRVECEYEKRLSGNNATGAIFALKNMGWRDKTEVDTNHSGGVKLIIEDASGCDPVDYETKVR